MIRSFRDRATERFFEGQRVAAFQSFAKQAERRLVLLDSEETLRDLAALPSNRLEALNLQKTWELRRAEIDAGREIAARVTPKYAAA